MRATYRLQLTGDFGFAPARGLIPYLRDLGISHLYLSPSLQARPGSAHGYDVIDPRRVSDELGGETSFRQLASAAREAGMGIVLDVVPNHMAADDGNRFWSDPALRERFFDIDAVTGRHRRFFDIDELAGMRQEDPEVFERTHELVLSLVLDGLVAGLRIDHPDGLADPRGYLGRLRSRGAERVWVEKILQAGEHLREWPVSGTVGYEFMNDVCALFVDPAGSDRLTKLWEEVSGDRRSFGEVALEAKLEQSSTTFRPEAERLQREHPSLPLASLERALASLPVYRTYVDPVAGVVAGEDRAALAHLPPELQRVLLLEEPASPGFVTRFQQATPAVTAKGVEDTAFYRYGRLLALNDVGGDPGRFGLSVQRFHAANAERAERFPLNLLTTMTHDAKRSGDVRARIAALASIPDEWAVHVERWFSLSVELREGDAPDDVERYFLFQTLVGAWPIGLNRVEAYMEKALREAKRNTSWVSPNEEWEGAVKRFCRSLLGLAPFLEDFEPFAARVGALGERAALGQLALKLTSPGVPDVYQGDELQFRALVDPDNRRPVDWGLRQALLARLTGGSRPDSETRKLFLIWRLLALRARRPEPFAGAYEPVPAGDATCAFVRGGDVLVVVAVRGGDAVAAGGRPEGILEAPRGRWRDVLRGGERSFHRRVAIADVDVVDDHGIAVYERIGG